jgi:hypothetical protein
MKHCPHCTGEVQDAAIRCRHCRRDLNGTDAPPSDVSLSTVPVGSRSFRTLTESDARLLRVGETVYLRPGGVVTLHAKPVLEERRISIIDLNTEALPSESLREQSDGKTSGTAAQSPTRSIGVVALMLVLAVMGYMFLGFYSIQPLGAVPDGQTWLVMRSDDEPFFESADGRCLRRLGSVSLLTRGVALGQAPSDRILIRLPYWRFAYLQSTGGQEFNR